ncbi:MAG TPA: peptidoglycan-binding domain-containing protein, partial [Acetobacteraceae bacterium]|nr:peptidoglycan-binding domain-containing protein [Acetobacteraceae bacterium]
AMFAGIATLARRIKAAPDAPVFVYVCGYASAFDARPFLLPVSAQVARPADLLTQGILAQSVVDAVTRNTKAPALIVLDAIPAPAAPDSLALERLAQDLPDSVGLLAVRDSGTGDQPTPLAAILTPALHGPALKGAALLAELKPQLNGHPTPQIAALHMPSDQLYLAGAVTPAAPAAATPAIPAAPAATAAPSAAPAAAPTAAPRPAAALPDEDQMTEAQRQQVQQALATLGYYDGRIDGIFGPETRAAIRRWQHEAHAPMTGHLTASQATQLISG